LGEWVIVVLRQFSNFSAISWREQVNFQRNDDEAHFVLDQHNDLFLLVLAHWSKSPRSDMSFYSYTLFWLPANKSLLILLNAACLAEKQQMPFLKSLVWLDRGLELMIYRTRDKYVNHYATDVVLISWCIMPTYAIFQLYRGVNKFYILLPCMILRNKTYFYIKQSGYIYK
jgi:hypothetical protein